MRYLHILEIIKPLSVASFANVFSDCVGCLFLFLNGFLCCAEKHWYDLCQNVLPMLSLFKEFLMSCLMFKSLGHFEFIFMYGERVCSNLINFHVAVQLRYHHLLNKLFPIVYSCLLCRRGLRGMSLSLGSLFCFIDLYQCCCASTMLF